LPARKGGAVVGDAHFQTHVPGRRIVLLG
jgi:hypothetical protein